MPHPRHRPANAKDVKSLPKKAKPWTTLFRWLQGPMIRRDEQAATAWIRFAQTAAAQGQKVLVVQSIYLVGRRGTKALVCAAHGGPPQDTWFWWSRLHKGAAVAVSSNIGYGPHTKRDDVIFVGSEQGGSGVHALIPEVTLRRARRHERRMSSTR